jgi:hypothetical protein
MISLKPESPEELRKRLREMSNLELRRFGERARKLSDPKMNFGATEPHVLPLVQFFIPGKFVNHGLALRLC